MVQRIAIADPALANRIDRAMVQMLSFYPDGKVARLDSDHKKLGERLSSLWRDVGYESRAAMLQAYGFQQVSLSGPGGGRPPAFDPEDLLAELQRRYEGKPKPKKLGLLIYENPDLGGNLKTLTNKANEVFGRTLAKELAARGILDKNPAAPDISDGAMKAFVDGLVAECVEVSEKPKTLGELKRRHPDKADLIDAFQKRCDELYGATAADYLKKSGVLRAGARYIDAAAVEAVLAEIEVASAGLQDSEKPLTITALALRYPDHAQLIKDGQLRGLFTKETLQERGILRLSEKAMRTKRKEMAASSIRNGKIEELVSAYRKCGGQAVVLPGANATRYLRSGVIGIDVDAGYELRETTLNLVNPRNEISPGTKVIVTVGNLDDSSDEIGNRISAPGMGAIDGIIDALDADYWIQVAAAGTGVLKRVARKGTADFLPSKRFDVDSDLSQFVDAEVTAVSGLGSDRALQVGYRFIAPLSNSTLVFALRELGAINEQDLLGGNAWRERAGAPGVGTAVSFGMSVK